MIKIMQGLACYEGNIFSLAEIIMQYILHAGSLFMQNMERIKNPKYNIYTYICICIYI